MAGQDPVSQKGSIGSSLDSSRPGGSPTVRFASANEEIEPVPLDDGQPIQETRTSQEEQSIKELSQSLQSTQLQGRRMSHFAFEPVSLPASRVFPCAAGVGVISLFYTCIENKRDPRSTPT
ncbi:hypothetical protein WAI453_003473 [Rhynchosporium graminicola]